MISNNFIFDVLFLEMFHTNSAVDTDDTIAYDVNFFDVTSHFLRYLGQPYKSLVN